MSARAELEVTTLRSARALVDRMRTLYRELEALTGAPISMHRALGCIGGSPGLQASRLAELLGMQRPAVSQVLRGMASRGWITRLRNAADQRAVRIFLTPEGNRLLRATAGRAAGTLQRAVHALTADNLERLARALPPLVALLPVAPPRLTSRNKRPSRTSRQNSRRVHGAERRAAAPVR